MELKDFVVTPIYIILLYGLAFFVRPIVTNKDTRRYFFPALTLKFIGAIALGLIYQFYYSGGDTFTFHTHGSRHIWEAFLDSPFKGLSLLFAEGKYDANTLEYASKIWVYRDASSYAVVRIATLFDLITYSTYSATALLFAATSFTGLWALYNTFYSIIPKLHFQFAIAVFFVPSLFFWGSGILKDTVTIGSLGWLTFSSYQIFFARKSLVINTVIFVLATYTIFSIKKYILLCFLPALIVWVFLSNLSKIKSFVLRILLAPFVLGLVVLFGYFSILAVAESDAKYALDNIAQTAKVTAYDIAYWTGKDAGSTYSLGKLDGTFSGMLSLAPAAINVSLFRPYIWEVKNPFMALSALESFILTFFTIYLLSKAKIVGIFYIGTKPVVLFCIVFSLVFAFAVGVSTFNFGTLARYKIPLMPFYASAIFMLIYHQKERQNARYSKLKNNL